MDTSTAKASTALWNLELDCNAPQLSGQDIFVALHPKQLRFTTKSVGQDSPNPGVVAFVMIEKYSRQLH